MEAKDELPSKLKKKHHREIIVYPHSRGGGSNATLVAAGLGTGEQRQEGQPAHRPAYPHLRTNSKAQTPRLQQKRWILLFRKASSIRAVCVFSFHFMLNFNCAACCLRLLDVVPVVSRSLHRLARCLRAALRRYSSGADRIRLCCCYNAVLCTCVRMVSVVPLFV